jgi:hypothetical protein
MTLYDWYKQCSDSYYSIPIINDSLWDSKTGKDECRDFIEKHYKMGRKDECMVFDFLETYLENGKHLHTASLYLLGMIFIKRNLLLRGSLESQLRTFLPQYDEWYKKDCTNGCDFIYTWYLTALYHDVASCIENIRLPLNPTERQKSLEFYLGELNITYSPYGAFPYRTNVIPQRFSEELVKNYFYYRANNGSCEHGIIAGYLFFDRFVKNFLKFCQDKTVERNGFILAEGNLAWHIEQISHAAYVADAIICHNLWMSNNEILYSAYGLSPLLYTTHEENKLSTGSYPLQFMLCLLDTIEPIKRFGPKPDYEGSLSAKEVLSNIGIEFQKTSIVLSWNNEIEEQDSFNKWKNSIMALNQWMNVECEDMNKNRPSIKISWKVD